MVQLSIPISVPIYINRGGAGSTLRHEAYHYNNKVGSTDDRNEYMADKGMFESIESAWEEFQRTGNTEGYPFIFETSEGMTFTKKREAQTTNAQSA